MTTRTTKRSAGESTWIDLAAAAQQLSAAGVVRCGAIEPQPTGFQRFWIASPASIIHLVGKEDGSW